MTPAAGAGLRPRRAVSNGNQLRSNPSMHVSLPLLVRRCSRMLAVGLLLAPPGVGMVSAGPQDSTRAERSAMMFITNANGQMVDSLQTGETPGTRNQDWDTVWNARGRRTSQGWEAEVAIPFKSLRFTPPPPGEEVVFGIGFKRNLPRSNEEATWPFVSNDSSWYRPAELGHLRGLRDIRPGRNLEIRPFALGGAAEERGRLAIDGRHEAGVDAKWSVTHLVSTRFELAFRRDLVLLPLLQYNADTKLLATNLRFNWIPKPGSDFFILRAQ